AAPGHADPAAAPEGGAAGPHHRQLRPRFARAGVTGVPRLCAKSHPRLGRENWLLQAGFCECGRHGMLLALRSGMHREAPMFRLLALRTAVVLALSAPAGPAGGADTTAPGVVAVGGGHVVPAVPRI